MQLSWIWILWFCASVLCANPEADEGVVWFGDDSPPPTISTFVDRLRYYQEKSGVASILQPTQPTIERSESSIPERKTTITKSETASPKNKNSGTRSGAPVLRRGTVAPRKETTTPKIETTSFRNENTSPKKEGELKSYVSSSEEAEEAVAHMPSEIFKHSLSSSESHFGEEKTYVPPDWDLYTPQTTTAKTTEFSTSSSQPKRTSTQKPYVSSAGTKASIKRGRVTYATRKPRVRMPVVHRLSPTVNRTHKPKLYRTTPRTNARTTTEMTATTESFVSSTHTNKPEIKDFPSLEVSTISPTTSKRPWILAKDSSQESKSHSITSKDKNLQLNRPIVVVSEEAEYDDDEDYDEQNGDSRSEENRRAEKFDVASNVNNPFSANSANINSRVQNKQSNKKDASRSSHPENPRHFSRTTHYHSVFTETHSTHSDDDDGDTKKSSHTTPPKSGPVMSTGDEEAAASLHVASTPVPGDRIAPRKPNNPVLAKPRIDSNVGLIPQTGPKTAHVATKSSTPQFINITISSGDNRWKPASATRRTNTNYPKFLRLTTRPPTTNVPQTTWTAQSSSNHETTAQESVNENEVRKRSSTGTTRSGRRKSLQRTTELPTTSNTPRATRRKKPLRVRNKAESAVLTTGNDLTDLTQTTQDEALTAYPAADPAYTNNEGTDEAINNDSQDLVEEPESQSTDGTTPSDSRRNNHEADDDDEDEDDRVVRRGSRRRSRTRADDYDDDYDDYDDDEDDDDEDEEDDDDYDDDDLYFYLPRRRHRVRKPGRSRIKWNYYRPRHSRRRQKEERVPFKNSKQSTREEERNSEYDENNVSEQPPPYTATDSPVYVATQPTAYIPTEQPANTISALPITEPLLTTLFPPPPASSMPEESKQYVFIPPAQVASTMRPAATNQRYMEHPIAYLLRHRDYSPAVSTPLPVIPTNPTLPAPILTAKPTTTVAPGPSSSNQWLSTPPIEDFARIRPNTVTSLPPIPKPSPPPTLPPTPPPKYYRMSSSQRPSNYRKRPINEDDEDEKDDEDDEEDDEEEDEEDEQQQVPRRQRIMRNQRRHRRPTRVRQEIQEPEDENDDEDDEVDAVEENERPTRITKTRIEYSNEPQEVTSTAPVFYSTTPNDLESYQEDGTRPNKPTVRLHKGKRPIHVIVHSTGRPPTEDYSQQEEEPQYVILQAHSPNVRESSRSKIRNPSVSAIQVAQNPNNRQQLQQNYVPVRQQYVPIHGSSVRPHRPKIQSAIVGIMQNQGLQQPVLIYRSQNYNDGTSLANEPSADPVAIYPQQIKLSPNLQFMETSTPRLPTRALRLRKPSAERVAVYPEQMNLSPNLQFMETSPRVPTRALHLNRYLHGVNHPSVTGNNQLPIEAFQSHQPILETGHQLINSNRYQTPVRSHESMRKPSNVSNQQKMQQHNPFLLVESPQSNSWQTPSQSQVSDNDSSNVQLLPSDEQNIETATRAPQSRIRNQHTYLNDQSASIGSQGSRNVRLREQLSKPSLAEEIPTLIKPIQNVDESATLESQPAEIEDDVARGTPYPDISGNEVTHAYKPKLKTSSSTVIAGSSAPPCDWSACKLPDCFCGTHEVIPGNLPPLEVPQMILLTFDDSVSDMNFPFYQSIFESGRTNPNGCPIRGTFYVSHEWTDYGRVEALHSQGHEIASHSISHSDGAKFSKQKWKDDIVGQKEILSTFGRIKPEDIRGMRAPFLQGGGNLQFGMLYEGNFTYDSSIPVQRSEPPVWPYTLDYKLSHECNIPPCPTHSFPGFWEVPLVMWTDLVGGRCSMADACTTPPDAKGVFQMLARNFERHYKTNRAPFGMYYHYAWFTKPHHKAGFLKFLDSVLKLRDVYFVTTTQMLQWMQKPTPVSEIMEFAPWQCAAPGTQQRKLQPCSKSRSCTYSSKGKEFRTCQACPRAYPWVGNPRGLKLLH